MKGFFNVQFAQAIIIVLFGIAGIAFVVHTVPQQCLLPTTKCQYDYENPVNINGHVYYYITCD